MAQFEELNDALDRLQEKIDELRRINNLKTPERLARSVVGSTAEIGESFTKLGIVLAVSAVRDGDLSQRAGADLLHMHPHTLAKWIDKLESLYADKTGQARTPEAIDNIA